MVRIRAGEDLSAVFLPWKNAVKQTPFELVSGDNWDAIRTAELVMPGATGPKGERGRSSSRDNSGGE